MRHGRRPLRKLEVLKIEAGQVRCQTTYKNKEKSDHICKKMSTSGPIGGNYSCLSKT